MPWYTARLAHESAIIPCSAECTAQALINKQSPWTFLHRMLRVHKQEGRFGWHGWLPTHL